MLMQSVAVPPSKRKQVQLFARNFLKHPRMLGSVIPSSRFLVDQVLDRIDWTRARLIVEYGPGVGNFTTEILRRMHPDAILIVVETNTEFVQFLRESLRDPRLRVELGSAANLPGILKGHGFQKASYIISGIPFSTMPPDVRDAILESSRDSLRSDGAFLVYQFSGKVLPHLERVFRHVHRDFELLNILPARLFFCSP
jgi:phospholipid N-methyltransferase